MSGPPEEPIGERDLLAYVDDRLEPERRRAVERHLAGNVSERARIADFLHQNEVLRRTLSGLANEPVPPALQRVLERPQQPLAKGGLPRTGLVAAGLACLVVLAGAGGWWLGRQGQTDRPAQDFVRALAALPPEAAVVATPWHVAHPSPSAPLELLERHVAMDLRAPNLTAEGWTLQQRALIEVDGRPTMRLVYIDARDRELAIFIRNRWSATRTPAIVCVTDRGEARTAYWYDGPLVWAAVADLDARELQALGRRAQELTRLPQEPFGQEVLEIGPLDDLLPPRSEGTDGPGVPLDFDGADAARPPP